MRHARNSRLNLAAVEAARGIWRGALVIDGTMTWSCCHEHATATAATWCARAARYHVWVQRHAAEGGWGCPLGRVP